mmetsp:Transcript_50887/g.61325  ORF Transcript_50887/g.61325 Transcript_50887/m.61325 type:complete len:231 (-) Transcript_50887:506-1198(-)
MVRHGIIFHHTFVFISHNIVVGIILRLCSLVIIIVIHCVVIDGSNGGGAFSRIFVHSVSVVNSGIIVITKIYGIVHVTIKCRQIVPHNYSVGCCSHVTHHQIVRTGIGITKRHSASICWRIFIIIPCCHTIIGLARHVHVPVVCCINHGGRLSIFLFSCDGGGRSIIDGCFSCSHVDCDCGDLVRHVNHVDIIHLRERCNIARRHFFLTASFAHIVTSNCFVLVLAPVIA